MTTMSTKIVWTRTEDCGSPIYSNGTYEIHRMDSTARSCYAWVLFLNSEPVMKKARYGSRIVAGDTLAQAKQLVEKEMS